MPETTKLSAKLAQDRKVAKIEQSIRIRVAAAWTLANTLMPGAKEAARFKVAENLLKNSTSTLRGMLVTAAKNTYNTRLAESFKEVHKVELNEFLDDPSVLNKEKSAVESELKGEPKNAGNKKAHGADCKGCDDCKAEKTADLHEDVGLTQAEDDKGLLAKFKQLLYSLDGSYTSLQLHDIVDQTLNGKTAGKKIADMESVGLTQAEDDKGLLSKLKQLLYSLDGSYTRLQLHEIVDKAIDGKTAAKKKADDTKDAGPQPAEYPDPKRTEPTELDGQNAAKRDESTIDKSAKNKKADVDGVPPVAEEETVEEVVPGEGEAEVTEEVVPEGDVPVEPVDEFDEEEASLTDAIEDTKDAIENLQEALDEKESEDDIILPEGEGEGDFTDEDFISEEEQTDGDFVDEEFDITRAFEPGTIEDKVSSLADEDAVTAAYGDDGEEFIEEETGEDFFGPSTPGELEGTLDQEEGLVSPADMFAGESVEDPLAALFASSSKRASSDEIVKPGELDDFFETSLSGDDRDFENDHEDDVLYEATKNVKEVEQGSERTKSDQEPQLEEPKNAGKTAGKKPLRLAPRDPRKMAHADRASIVTALFGED